MRVVIRTRRLFRMIWKEMVHLKRDRVSLTMMIALPVVQLTLFGYAINTEVKNLSLVVIDPNPSSDSRYIVESFVNTGYFRFAGYINCYDELRLLLDENKVRAGLVFPPDFKSRFRANKSVSVQLIVDATDPLASRSAIATARALGLHHSLRMKMGESIAGFEMPLDIRVRGWYNPDMRSADFMVPGLIGVIIQLITVLVTALSVVREREFGTMEQLLASPLRRWEIVVGKLTPPLITTYIIITISLLLAYFVFGVAIEGNIILLYFLTFPFLLVALGIGIFISTIAKNQLQAMQMSFFFFLPSIMLSGFIFPIDAMPNVIRQICYAIPLTYFLNIIRGIIVKGVGLYELRLDTLVLLTMGVLVITLSIMRMGKRLG